MDNGTMCPKLYLVEIASVLDISGATLYQRLKDAGTVVSQLNALRVYNLDCPNELQTA